MSTVPTDRRLFMARRSRRRDSILSARPIGRPYFSGSGMGGRRSLSSRNLVFRPRPSFATALTGPLTSRFRSGSGPFIRRPGRPVVSVVRSATFSQPGARARARVVSPRDTFRPILPFKGKGNVCVQRSRRRSVLFSLDVAGRGWSAGGPRMRGARRSEDSNSTCVR